MGGVPLLILAILVLLSIGMAIWRTHLAVSLQVLFLARAEVLLILTPLLIAFLAWVAPSMFRNLVILDQRHPVRDPFYVSVAGFASAWMSLALIRVVLDRANERFGVAFTVPRWFWSIWFDAAFMLPPVFLMYRVYRASPDARISGFVAGFLVALVPVAVVDFVFHLFDPPAAASGKRARNFAFAGTVYPHVIGEANPFARIGSLIFRPLSWLGPGYLWPDHGPYAPTDPALIGIPYPEHIASTVAVLIGTVVWAISYFLGFLDLSKGHGTTGVPALAYVELLFLLVALVLSSASFMLDRVRFPVFAAFVVYAVAGSLIFGAETDHYWDISSAGRASVQPAGSGSAAVLGTRVKPGQIQENGPEPALPKFPDGLDAWLAKYSNSDEVLRADNQPAVVVICAAGGGIQAAAWMAIAMRGLQHEFGDRFIRSIRLISSTSGGSVGALYFVDLWFEEHHPPEGSELKLIVDASEMPSLDATGWGMLHPDFINLAAPIIPYLARKVTGGSTHPEVDRGWAIEKAWSAAFGSDRQIKSRFSDWRDAVENPEILLPGTVFNATIVETGSPLVLSTVRFAHNRSVLAFGQDVEQGSNLSNVTAARLSATFPYVSPVVRARDSNNKTAEPLKGYHVADGGYYDNYGFTAAAAWINDAAHHYHDRIGRIIVIPLEAFPDQSYEQSSSIKPQRRWLDPNSGWGSEILGPVNALLHARSATQLGHDGIERDLLGNLDYLKYPSGANKPDCSFVTVVPIIATDDPKNPHSVRPLSWQLSDEEKRAIQDDWDMAIKQQAGNIRKCLK